MLPAAGGDGVIPADPAHRDALRELPCKPGGCFPSIRIPGRPVRQRLFGGIFTGNREGWIMNDSIFHLAFPVRDLAQTRRFYIENLGFAAGRESPAALIINMGGHQIVAQLSNHEPREQDGIYPRHFGLIFDDRDEWQRLVDRVRRQGMEFYREPMARFPGQVLEHDTFFLCDPSGNLLEFKYYHHRSAIFGETGIASIGDKNR